MSEANLRIGKRAVLLLLLVVSCAKQSDVPLADVRRDDLVIGVEVTGELAAVDSTVVKPPLLQNFWNFKIVFIANEGEDVKAGQPVLAFDASDLLRQQEQMQSEVDAAQKKLEQKRQEAALARRDDDLKVATAEADLRKASLKAEGSPDLTALVELQTAKLDAETAKLALDGAKTHAAESKAADDHELAKLEEKASYAQARLAAIQTNIAKMSLAAPRGGTVVLPPNWQGEKHKIGDSVWQMEEVMDLVGLGKMIGKGVVDEVDIARVAPGQHVSLRLDALPDVQLAGTVDTLAKNVEPKSYVDPSKVEKLEIAIAPTTVTLRPGMRFRGLVEVERRPQVIVVPVDAVFVKPEGPIAYRKSGAGWERVKLELGKRSATFVEVVHGLDPGDRVARVEPAA